MRSDLRIELEGEVISVQARDPMRDQRTQRVVADDALEFLGS